MNSYVTPPDGRIVHRSTDLSPELALVDPMLADDARSWLPQPDDTVARLELLVRAHRIAASREPGIKGFGVAAETDGELLSGSSARDQRRTGHRRSAVIAGATAAAVVFASLLVGVRVDLHGTSAGAGSTSIGVPPDAVVARVTSTTTSAPKTSAGPQKIPDGARPATSVAKTPARPNSAPNRPQSRSHPTGLRTPRRFVWAPVKRASGYHVEFFRGSSRVFSANTARPEVSLPLHWSLGGRPQALHPGQYHWYVWPLIAGRRSSGAVVQAKLNIPSS
jgi:hypothetical protein